jgi:hypothetical protein
MKLLSVVFRFAKERLGRAIFDSKIAWQLRPFAERKATLVSLGGLVLREDVGAGESLLEAFSEVFLTRQVDQGPARGSDTDDAPGSDAFDDLVRLETNLNAAAT